MIEVASNGCSLLGDSIGLCNRQGCRRNKGLAGPHPGPGAVLTADTRRWSQKNISTVSVGRDFMQIDFSHDLGCTPGTAEDPRPCSEVRPTHSVGTVECTKYVTKPTVLINGLNAGARARQLARDAQGTRVVCTHCHCACLSASSWNEAGGSGKQAGIPWGRELVGWREGVLQVESGAGKQPGYGVWGDYGRLGPAGRIPCLGASWSGWHNSLPGEAPHRSRMSWMPAE